MSHLIIIAASATFGLLAFWVERALESAQMAVGGEGR